MTPEYTKMLGEAIKWMQALQGPKDGRLEPDQSKAQSVIALAGWWGDDAP